jgi:hypothetical protein
MTLLQINRHQRNTITYTMRRASNEKTCASTGLRLECKSSLKQDYIQMQDHKDALEREQADVGFQLGAFAITHVVAQSNTHCRVVKKFSASIAESN